jgi:hypothetical protein
VKSGEQVVFRGGRVNQVDATVPDNCGCPPPAIPEMRASAATAPTISEKDLPPEIHLAQPGDKAKPVPPPNSDSGIPAPATRPEQVTLTILPPDAQLPAPAANAPHVQVEAPFVFRASDSPASAPNLATETLPVSRANPQAPLLTTAEPPQPQQRKGVFGKMKGFFAGLFR